MEASVLRSAWEEFLFDKQPQRLLPCPLIFLRQTVARFVPRLESCGLKEPGHITVANATRPHPSFSLHRNASSSIYFVPCLKIFSAAGSPHVQTLPSAMSISFVLTVASRPG